MKTAIYIEDGVVQLVLTPETEFERKALKSFADRPLDARIMAGSFYDCRGGWVRQSEVHNPYMVGSSDANDRSLILRMDDQKGDAT